MGLADRLRPGLQLVPAIDLVPLQALIPQVPGFLPMLLPQQLLLGSIRGRPFMLDSGGLGFDGRRLAGRLLLLSFDGRRPVRVVLGLDEAWDRRHTQWQLHLRQGPGARTLGRDLQKAGRRDRLQKRHGCAGTLEGEARADHGGGEC